MQLGGRHFSCYNSGQVLIIPDLFNVALGRGGAGGGGGGKAVRYNKCNRPLLSTMDIYVPDFAGCPENFCLVL